MQKKLSNAKKRGRKCSVSVDTLHSLLNQNAKKIFKDDRLVLVSESDVYERIASRFNNYTAKAVYLQAKRYFRPKHISKAKKKSECSDYIKTYDRHNLKPQQYTEFNVSIDGIPFFRNDKGEMKPMAEWLPIFRKIVFTISQAPCAWSVDRPRMVGNDITINGHCLEDECHAKFFAFSQNNHAQLTIQVTPSYQTIRHTKKNQIRGEIRRQILEMLKTDKAMVVVVKVANECSRIGDLEPQFLPNANARRKMKAGKYDHLILDSDPMISLREMKYTEPYQNSIGNIGLDPFDIFFATPYQKTLLKMVTNRKRIVISFDATGVPVTPPKTSSYSIEHGRFKSIFLYVIMVHGSEGVNSPVYQFLSQRQDAINIRFALDTWKQKHLNNKNPDEVITDAGAAVVLAGTKAFAQCNDCMEYGDKCYDALFEGENPPAAYIRLDRAHTVHSITTMFKGLDRNKKRFYTRILGLLLLSDDIDEVKVIIENMFIALLNRFQYDNVVSQAITFLKNVTDSHNTLEEVMNSNLLDENQMRFMSDEKKNFITKNDKHKFFKWIESILEDVKIYVNTDLNDSIERPTSDVAENPFYEPQIEQVLVSFLSKIHQWSNIMMKSFGSTNSIPTSASSESHFNILEQVVFPHEKKVRPDIFTRRYIDYLNGIANKSIVAKNTNDAALRKRRQSGNDPDEMESVSDSSNHQRSKRPKLDGNTKPVQKTENGDRNEVGAGHVSSNLHESTGHANMSGLGMCFTFTLVSFIISLSFNKSY